MKVTTALIQKALVVKLPTYYITSKPEIIDGDKRWGESYPGLWFQMAFTYPGANKQRWLWLSIKADMTADELDTWTTDAVIQMKLTQEVEELNQKAKDFENRASDTAPAIGE